MEIILSIVTCGRNDDFAGNFVQRLEHNINKLIDNIEKLNIKDVEIIITDWGSNEKLYDVTNIPKKDFVNFLHIPFEICKKYSPDSNFSLPHAINSAIRRSEGHYLLYIDGDSYIPLNSFEKLYNLLKNHSEEDNVYYWISRYLIPYKYQSDAKNISDMDILLDDWVKNGKPVVPINNISEGFFYSKVSLDSFGGGAMGLLVSRKIAFETSFLYERLTKWGWMDVEFFQRMSNKYRCLGDLSEDLNSEFYHIGHHEIKVGHDVHGFNPNLRPGNFMANNENWGLMDEELKFN